MLISSSLLAPPASAAATMTLLHPAASAIVAAARTGGASRGSRVLERGLLTPAPSSRSTSTDLGRRTPTRRNAGLTEIEPDLEEDKRDQFATNGISPMSGLDSALIPFLLSFSLIFPFDFGVFLGANCSIRFFIVPFQEDFVYGEYDGHHTYFEGEKKPTFWESVMEEYNAAEPPTGFQGLISWLFLPAVVAAMAYHVPGEYLYIGAGIFVVIFCGIEMDKPDKPHNFEPQIYNMERESRDKLIADYNTMDIWDFNEKYGDLWDFTIKRDRL